MTCLLQARDLPANMFAHLLELHTLDLSACDMPSFGPKKLPSVTHLLKLRALLLPKDYLLDANMVLALGVALQLQELEATAHTAMEAMQLVHCLRGSQVGELALSCCCAGMPSLASWCLLVLCCRLRRLHRRPCALVEVSVHGTVGYSSGQSTHSLPALCPVPLLAAPGGCVQERHAPRQQRQVPPA